MCGIFGFLSNKNINIEKFINPIERRGPDEKKYFSVNDFKIGATRLSIRDLENGSQPFFFEQYGTYVALNGEIYNYEYLRNKIVEKGYKFKSNCDTELIGPGYHFFGNNFFNMINGMFAIAILDIKKDMFLLARDRFGIKPIYYHLNKNEFYFSSSARSIFQMESFKKELDLDNLASILKKRYIDKNLHIFKNIYQVKPGHLITFSRTELLKSIKFVKEDKLVTKENLENTIHNFFNISIQHYKISDVEICLLISSGIDSNLIFNYLYEKNIKIFNISFENSKYDELKKIRKLLTDEQASNLNVIEFTKDKFINNISETIKAFDSPICDSVIFPMFSLFDNISEKYKVTISGEGADEIFGGYDFIRYTKIFLFIRKYKLKNFVYWLVRIIPTSILSLFISYQGNFDKLFKKRLLKLLGSDDADLIDFNNFLSVFDDQDLSQMLYQPIDLKKSTGDKNKKLTLENIFFDLINSWLPNYNCFKLDQLSMHKSLEARVPFLDNTFYNIVNFYKNNIKLYNGKKNLKKILEIKTKKKIRKKIAFQNYLSPEKKTSLVDFVEMKIKEDFKIFRFIKYSYFLKIVEKFKKSNELIIEKQFFSILILSLWFEENL